MSFDLEIAVRERVRVDKHGESEFQSPKYGRRDGHGRIQREKHRLSEF